MLFFSALLDKLSLKPKIAGLQISDSSVQYVFLGKSQPISASVRLTPGIIREGKLENSDQLLAALNELRKIIVGGELQKKIRVIVSLPPAIIYTQSFSVPKIDEGKLREAAKLNLQIISPIEANQAYMNSQVLAENEDRFDLLGAFVARKAVDDFKNVLDSAKFEIIAFEFPALALVRAVRENFTLPPKPFLLIDISSDGLVLLIMKGGSLYFEYFRSWHSVQGEKREISKADFETVVTQEVKKVMDFSLTRFKEKIDQAFVVAPSLETEIAGILSKFGIQSAALVLKNYQISSGWYAALGSALRGVKFQGQDREINLSSRSMVDVFYEERLLNFIRLWRNIVMASAGLLFVVFAASALLLTQQSKTLNQRLREFTGRVSGVEFIELQQKAREFNILVNSVAKTRSEARSWYQILNRIKTLADKQNVTVTDIGIGSRTSPITLSGTAPSTAQVIKFKNVLVVEPKITDVELPLAGITTLKDNFVSFSLTFKSSD